MARKSARIVIPPTFVGTLYSVQHGVYFATRKDGTVTVGRIGERGMNVDRASVTNVALPGIRVEA